ncbi:MAG: hypothetical protein RJA35_1338 [Actinomycetota bacterium]|jgi:hypothetical protein
MTKLYCQAGSITAEFAILMPAVVAVLVAIISIGTVQLQSLALDGQAGQLARGLEAGLPLENLRAAARKGGSSFHDTPVEGFDCITLRRNANIFGLGVIPLESKACGLEPGR